MVTIYCYVSNPTSTVALLVVSSKLSTGIKHTLVKVLITNCLTSDILVSGDVRRSCVQIKVSSYAEREPFWYQVRLGRSYPAAAAHTFKVMLEIVLSCFIVICTSRDLIRGQISY